MNANNPNEKVYRGQRENMASLFTGNRAATQNFRYEVQAGNNGINIGLVAPMELYQYSGWKDNFSEPNTDKAII